jgi:DNA replication licensing factor MCM3
MAKNLLERGIQGDQKPRFEAKLEHYRISFEGNLGANFVTPRGLGSKLANELVGIQGIITKMEIPKHQLEKSVHYCEKTKAFEVKEYPDNLNPEKDFEPSKTRFIKTHDDNSNPLSFEYGMSSFRNIQTVVIQELPEMAPPGLLPQSVTVVLQGELVNSVKPGDRVQMIGIYKLIGGAMSKEKGIFRPYFLCLSVKQLSEVLHTGVFTNRNVIPEADLIGICSRSVAPSIYGHDELKKAVLLMLLGGEEKNLDNGTHLRGDINLLMVGDPGTAKSQILRWVLSTAELAIGTTGSGASGVGLTAAIVSDKDTGEKTLEAGAMVLADRGVVCIDEFDKMNEVDRVAVHEVMEQQTVTIAKAGMHCSLNARCSVIAAANPIYGEYQTTMAPTKNIGMPDSLLSRFDLVFIILDEKSPEKDKRIGERVCRNHRLAPKVAESYHTFNEDDEYIIHPNETQQSGRGDQVY